MPLTDRPWGVLLLVYFVVVGVPSGLTLAALWHRSRWPWSDARTERWATWAALAVLTLASVLLIVDLGRPERFFLMITRFDNLGSPISVGAKIIAVKTAVLVAAAYLLHRRHDRAGRPLPAGNATARMADTTVVWLLGVTSLALAIYPVSVLARTWFAPLAGTSGAALLFLLTALLMGAAGLLAIEALGPERTGTDRVRAGVRTATLALLGGYAVAIVFEALAVRGNPAAQHAAVATLTTTGGAIAFWGLVVGVGIVLPAAGLLTVANQRWVRLGVAAAILAGAGVSRYLIFAVG